MQDGVFFSKSNIAYVTPIFKNGCKYTASNYCPISVLSPFFKYLKKLFAIDLKTTLETTLF